MTHQKSLRGSRKGAFNAACYSQVMSPTQWVGALMASSSILRRRRHSGEPEESADDRLDRLIRLEMSSRAEREVQPSERHELRRLRVDVEERPSGAAIEDRAPHAGVREDPMDRLVPLFDELALGPRGPTVRNLQPDQGEPERARPDRALLNVAEPRGQVPGAMGQGALPPGQGHHCGVLQGGVLGVRPDVLRLTEHGMLHQEQGHRWGELQGIGPGQEQPRGRSLSQEFAAQASHGGPPHLMGPMYDPGMDPASGQRGMDQGYPVVVPVVDASGNPEVELLPQEQDHGLDVGAAVSWTHRQIGGLVRSAGNALRSHVETRGEQGHDQMETMDSEVERIRQRCLQEAEVRYQQEIRRLRGEEVASYHTASSGGQGELSGHRQPALGGEEGRAQAGAAAQPLTSPGVGGSGLRAPSPPPGLNEGQAYGGVGRTMTSPGYGQTPVRADHVPAHGGLHRGGNQGGHQSTSPPQVMGCGERAPPSMYTEQVRGSDLPPLPTLGGDQAPLLFGDWLALVAPAMFDIAHLGKEWWNQVMEEVEALYTVWLQASPLQRLRLRPAEGTFAPILQRVEMKGVNMLLQVLPENIKRDVVASRTLSSTSIMFKLYTLYQPGGSAEKTGLLKQISEPKVTGNGQDLLQSIRTWRRWLARAQELRLILPDSMILAGVLGRFSDALAKNGNAQLGFRLSTARQELGVDYRPTREAVWEMAEYLQAEAEELVLSMGLKSQSQAAAQPSTATTPVVKAMNYNSGNSGAIDQGDQEKGKSFKAPCRFWKSEEGCRKGIECTYLHDTADMKGRCFGCGATSHIKKDCPVKKSADGGAKPERVKKIGKTKPEKGVQPGAKDQHGSASSTSTTDGKKAEKGEPSGNDTKVKSPQVSSVPVQAEVAQGVPVDPTNEILKEAAGLLKSLRGIKAVKLKSVDEGRFGDPGQYALLDGGATNGLRMARAEEIPHMEPTTVELAHGTTTLYRMPGHHTLLSKTAVEPIIPLGWLVQCGYRINWGADQCVIQHPDRGPLQCILRSGCPVMPRDQGLQLLDDLEKGYAGTKLNLSDGTEEWWKHHFPQVPHRLLQWTAGQGKPWKELGPLPWNRHQRKRLWRSKGVMLHLFAGEDHKPWNDWRRHGFEVLCLDIRKGGDLHSETIWSFLWDLASADKLVGIIGGPPCRTVSRLRMRQPGPPPLRDRRNASRWGLETLSPADQRKTDYDSMLMLKQLALWRRSEEVRTSRVPTMFVMESPEDPMNYLQEEEAEDIPSFWMFPEVEDMLQKDDFKIISFDQGCMGHRRRKPTSLLTNVIPLHQLDGLREEHRRKDPLPGDAQETMKESCHWSKWAPGLVAAIVAAGKMHLHQLDQQFACRKLDVEGFKKHILNHHAPYRRDCRRCLETMGYSNQHRRSYMDQAAYCMSVDLAGPYPLGKDEGNNKRTKAKYLVVATVAVPKLPREGDELKVDPDSAEAKLEDGPPQVHPSGADGPREVHEKDLEADQLDLLEELEDDEKELISEEDVSKVNAEWKKKAEELSATIGLQNLTLTEITESRHSKDVTPAIGRLYARFRALGIPIFRIHSDRERCFITKLFQTFCIERSLFQTMTSGDAPQENGRVEAEVAQVKRRLRLVLKESKLPQIYWPCVARWVGEQRLRQQLLSLGVPSKPMILPGTKVMVKQKLWNKPRGPLALPYKQMTLLGPSPTMSSGYVLKDGNKVQHARAVVLPAAEGERAHLELQEAPRRRIVGKQAPALDYEKLPPPLQTQDEDSGGAELMEPELGGVEVVVPEVEEFQYSPESPVPDDELEGIDPPDPSVAPPAAMELDPALHALKAGGETVTTATADVTTGGISKHLQGAEEYVTCDGCGLMQGETERECGFCLATLRTMPCSTSSRSGSAAMPCSTSSRSGSAAMPCSTSSRSGTAAMSCSTPSVSGLAAISCLTGVSEGKGNVWTVDPGEIVNQLQCEHWGWKEQWNKELGRTVVGAEDASRHGEHLEFLEAMLLDLEEELDQYGKEPEGVRACLKAVQEGIENQSVHPVLQTYTVGLAEVRNNIELWRPAIKKELESLFEVTKALRRTTVEELKELPGGDQAEQAPAKVVSTIKAPDGRRKVRIVICGNLVQSAAEAAPSTETKNLSNPLYAGGLDGTALRAVARKAAACQWSIGSTDIKTAFLLAPRKDKRVMIIRPPQLLIDCGLAGQRERWIVDRALYGLETSPRDWSQFRDQEMGRMSWREEEMEYRFRQTTEPNIWKVVAAPLNSNGQVDEELEETSGFMVTYVDDILVAAPRKVAEQALAKIRSTWECSPVEWTTDGCWMRFCGMEFQWHGDHLRVGQGSYAKELISRHGRQQPRSCPGPKVESEVMEDDITPEDVKVAQQLVGEILWLAVRTRPDLAYVTSWMGRHVARAPKLVKQVAMHTLGYLQETADYALSYGPCSPDELMKVLAYSDASHAPQGGRGCQGILVQWGGATVQWEAKAQPFAALSSTESELIGYVDALTMGESFGAVVNALENNRLALEGQYCLRGDNLSGLQLLSSPDGPWRTRHLRLRSFVLRERIANRDWEVEHIPGAELCVWIF